MAYADLAGYLDDDAIDTPPISSVAHPAGRSYRIPSPDAATGIRLTAMVSLGVDLAVGADLNPSDAERLKLDDDQEREFLRDVLGSAYDELVADGVSWVRIQRLGRYALLYFTLGPEAAANEARRPAGEAPAPNRETRRATKKTSSRGSSGSGRASRTRGSTAGTTSPSTSRGKAARA